ncbi:MAG: type IV secretory system conjugative DNA transfer family protein [Xanthomonadaceae bacterium]|nr:type IV secretory system conjugative DNA transfer family protein [Xanthomonadaceae bacterium]
METRPDGSIIVYIGITRSGKSTPVKEVCNKNSRVLAYDPKGEYAQLGFVECETREQLWQALKNTTGPGKIAFVANSRKDFQFWCDCAYNWNRQKQAVLVAEELANVTNAGKAEDNWGRLINQSMAFGPLILATVQRGQEVDKGLMNNASALHIAQHQTDDDAGYIAGKIGVGMEMIPREQLRFIVWRGGKGVLIRNGQVTFANNKPKFRGIKAGSNRAVPLSIEKTGRFKGVEY